MKNGTLYGAPALYTCIDGYVIEGGHIIRQCKENGQWSGSAPSCKPYGSIYINLFLVIYQTRYRACEKHALFSSVTYINMVLWTLLFQFFFRAGNIKFEQDSQLYT